MNQKYVFFFVMVCDCTTFLSGGLDDNYKSDVFLLWLNILNIVKVIMPMKKQGKKKSLAEQLADIDSVAPDYDPEDFTNTFSDKFDLESNDNDDSDIDLSEGRNHYVQVSPSVLRKQAQPLMDDPKYTGKSSSRKKIFDDEEDSAGEEDGSVDNIKEDEDDEWEDVSEGEQEENIIEFKKNVQQVLPRRATRKESGDMDNDIEEIEMNEGESEEEELLDEDAYTEDRLPDDKDETMKEELKNIQEEERSLLRTISQVAKSDIEKGENVKTQILLWDAFLDSRIRIQKIISIANEFPQHDMYEAFLAHDDVLSETIKEARGNLQELLDVLIDMRKNLFQANDTLPITQGTATSRKRHLEENDETAYEEALWDDIKELDDIFTPHQNQTIEKWSNKVQITSGIPLNKKFKAFDQSVMAQINNILADRERLIKRTQLKRSQYRVLGKPARSLHELSAIQAHLQDLDCEVFDDTDFYQSLIHDLIESRMVDTGDPLANGIRWAAVRQSKQKKTAIDTKASKGRRLRYHVHEKLQNFMSSLSNGMWHEEMTDELYASLLGRKVGKLTEERDDDEKNLSWKSNGVDGMQVAVDGLRIFG